MVNVSFSVLGFRDLQEVDMVRKMHFQRHGDNASPVQYIEPMSYEFL